MSSKAKNWICPVLVFLAGLSWALVPCYLYFVDSIGYLNSFYNGKLSHLLYHPYHPLFPGLWRLIWTVSDAKESPTNTLREGAIMVSFFSGLGLLATFLWGRKIGLSSIESLLGALALGGLGAWAYFSNNWACYIPAISLMLSAFLLVVADHLADNDNLRSKNRHLLWCYGGGILLGLSTGFHILTILALPGLVFILWSKSRDLYRSGVFIIGYMTAVILIWLTAAHGYKSLPGNIGLLGWLSSSYGANAMWWGPFNFLLQLNADYIGIRKVLFMGVFPSELGPGMLQEMSIIKIAGCIFALGGLGLFFFNALFHGIKTIEVLRRKGFIRLRWGLLSIWLPLAIYSSIYVAYHSHYRLFAWAIFWWLLLLIYANIQDIKWRRLGFIALLIFVVGMWSHNIFAGPLRWGSWTNNPYLVEVSMINETPYKSAPAILDSDPMSYARVQHLMLFRGGAYSATVYEIKMHHSDSVYTDPQLKTHYIWVTDTAMKELGWEIDMDGNIVSENELFRIKGLEIGKLKVKMNLNTPLGFIYLLSCD